MLRYYITRQQLPEIQTQNATPFTLRSAEKFKGKVFPFSHIYVASDPYSRRIKKALSKEDLPHFEELNANQKKAIESHQRFPVNFKSQDFSSVAQMREWITEKIGDKNTINIVVVNGIGTGFGDNFVGLGAIQRLTNLLAPNKVVFHLMQTMNARSMPIYMHSPNILLKNNCMLMSEFLSMDLMINLTGMLGFAEFDQQPLAQFQSHVFSISKLVPTSSLHPKLHLDECKVSTIKNKITQHFNNDRKTVLIHPQASSPIRTMPQEKTLTITKELIRSGFNVVCAFPDKNKFKNTLIKFQ